MAEAKKTCATCRFHRPPAVINLVDPGVCAWPPPPALARLYAMLAQEPEIRIDYANVFEELPSALKSGACGGYEAKPDAVEQSPRPICEGNCRFPNCKGTGKSPDECFW